MSADQAAIHNFLVEQLSTSKAQLIDFAFKHGTLVCVLLGWVISSEQAQRFYTAAPSIRVLTSIGLLVYAGLYIFWVRETYQRSKRILRLLRDLGYMEPKYFDVLIVRRLLAGSLASLHLLLCGGMIVFIWLIPLYKNVLLSTPKG